MSAFAELPPGTVLPPIGADAAAGLQSAQDGGRLRLADTDEAELAAIGAPAFPREGRPDITDAEIERGAQRLTARGLAEPVPWQRGRVRPAGNLLTYLQLVLHPKARIGMLSTWFHPQLPGSVRTTYRVTVLIDVVHGGLACVERASVSQPRPVQALAIEVLRLDLFVEAAVSAAFGDDDLNSSAVRETLVLFADGSGTQQPTRLRVGGTATAELESSRHGLPGNRTVRDEVDRSGFAEHLRLRLMAAG